MYPENGSGGMDLNPLFTSIDAFRPAGDGGELKLFELAGVKLYHGWLADPDGPEYDVVSRFAGTQHQSGCCALLILIELYTQTTTAQ